MRKTLFFLALSIIMAAASFSAMAIQPDEMLKDEKLEHRAREISAELRCLVCQNQSIDDSDASLAKDLRLLVRERLQQGESNSEVIAFIVDRYGEFVLLRPVFQAHTLVLWLTPAVALLLPAVVLFLGAGGFYAMSRRRKNQGVIPLSQEEQAELDALLKK